MLYGEPIQLTLGDRLRLVWNLLRGKWEAVAYLNPKNRADLQTLIDTERQSGARLFHTERIPAVFVPGLWQAHGESMVRLLPVGGTGDVMVVRERQ